jgi:hypothetical protein
LPRPWVLAVAASDEEEEEKTFEFDEEEEAAEEDEGGSVGRGLLNPLFPDMLAGNAPTPTPAAAAAVVVEIKDAVDEEGAADVTADTTVASRGAAATAGGALSGQSAAKWYMLAQILQLPPLG